MLKNQKQGVGNAQKYSAWAENAYTWKYIEKPSFVRNLKKDLNSRTRIIEAGCGAGRTINFLLQNGAKESNILGIDVDSELLAYSKKSFPKVHYIHNSISEKLPIEENIYDMVTCHNVLHYLNQKQFTTAIKNFYSWLKKDGILFIMTPHPVRMSKDLTAYFFSCILVFHQK